MLNATTDKLNYQQVGNYIIAILKVKFLKNLYIFQFICFDKATNTFFANFLQTVLSTVFL